MRRFTFTTTATPMYSGEGVEWQDGDSDSATYRIKVGPTTNEFDRPYTGRILDLTNAYGGLPGYSLDYTD